MGLSEDTALNLVGMVYAVALNQPLQNFFPVYIE